MVEVYRAAREISRDLAGHDDGSVALGHCDRLYRVTVFLSRLRAPSLDRLKTANGLALVVDDRVDGNAPVQQRWIVLVLRREIELDRPRKCDSHELAQSH